MPIEREIKVLEINSDEVCKLLEKLGAEKVYDDVRTITHFDTADSRLAREEKSLKLTEEGRFKLTATEKLTSGERSETKTTVGGKNEICDILGLLGLSPITRADARRISYELDGVDYDIDFFPGIPPFMEVDLEHTSHSQEELLTLLNLEDRRVVTMSTMEIFTEYGKTYSECFKVE